MNTTSTDPAGGKPSDWYAGPSGWLRPAAIHTLIVVLASLISSVLILLLAICTPGPVQAAELAGYTLGAHVGTVHVPHRDNEHNINPGLYVRSPSGITLGAYANSLGRPSMYLAQSFTRGAFGLTVGAVSGYRRREVPAPCDEVGSPADWTGCTAWDTRVKATFAPLVVPSVTLPAVAGLTPRLAYIHGLGKRKTAGLHLSVEHTF